MPLKTAWQRGIRQIWLGLRVRNWVVEVSFGPLSPRTIFGVSFLDGHLEKANVFGVMDVTRAFLSQEEQSGRDLQCQFRL